MGRNVKVEYPGGEVVLTNRLPELVEKYVNELTGGLLDAMTRAASDVVAEAKAAWPVKTGTSRDSFRVRQSIGADEVKVAIVNTAKKGGVAYTYLISSSNVKYPEAAGKQVRPWDLVRKRAKKVVVPAAVEAANKASGKVF